MNGKKKGIRNHENEARKLKDEQKNFKNGERMKGMKYHKHVAQ